MATKRIENLIKSVNSRLQPLMEFDRFYAALYDPMRSLVEFPWVVRDGRPVEWVTRPYQPTSWLLDSIIHAESPRLVEQDFEQELEKDSLKYWPEGDLPQSWLAAPMITEDRVIGVLVAENQRKPKAFGENGIRVLSTAARQAAVAIENSRLVDQRDRKIASLSALYEMGQKLNSEIRSDETKILQLIYRQASLLMDTTNLYIALYEKITNTISFPLMFVDGKATQVPSRSGGKGRTEWIVQNREPMFDETRAESEAWYKVPGREEYIGEPFASWLGVPMMVGDKVLGVIATYHKTLDYVYTKDDQEILSLMANQAAVAIENARLYYHLEERVQERTQDLVQAQSRIADMERGLVYTSMAADFVHRMNNLAGTILPWVNMVKKQLGPASRQNEKALSYLDQIAGNAQNLLDAAQKLTNPLPPPEKVDLKEMVEQIVRQKEIAAPPEVEFSFTCEDHLPFVRSQPQLAEALSNILNNAVKAVSGHGKIIVKVRCVQNLGRDMLEVEISDLGSGISPERLGSIFQVGKSYWPDGKGMGYGLWRAKNIIEGVGGKISVTSQVGKSTTFRVILPPMETSAPHNDGQEELQ